MNYYEVTMRMVRGKRSRPIAGTEWHGIQEEMRFATLPTLGVILASTLSCLPMEAQLFHRLKAKQGGGSAISLRKRLHVNTLITEPGTVEVDWANLFSVTSGDYAMPSAIKYTPEGSTIPWGRTEYSIAFDTLAATDAGGGKLVRFSQAVSITGTAVLIDGEKLDIAIAPQASFFLRDESGARLGATAIVRYDSGRNSTGFTLGWSGATHSSATNPAGTLDAGFGYGRNLSGSPLLEKFTPHTNMIWERSTGVPGAVALFEGVEYQMTDRVAFDLSGQHFGLRGATPDNQVVVGMTVSLGRLK